MRTSKRIVATRAAVIVTMAVTSVSCGSDTTTEPAGPSTSASPSSSHTPASQTPTTRPPDPSGTTITSATSDFGEVLWGPDRQVVYIWQREPSEKAECYGDCAEAWPPVLTSGEPVAAGKVDRALLGTTTRRDGSTQVTYNDHPLYYYAHEGPGEVTCHDIATHGGLWWVVTPAGDRAA
jgi:predicted lipoprotein with Yx(FWY)xxD motif